MARTWFYIAFVSTVLIFPREVDCLDCYKCTSSVSWKDCDSHLSKTKCPAASHKCLKGVLTCTSDDEKKITYYKRCAAQGERCDNTREDTPQCPSLRWAFRFLDTCCSGSYCNSAHSGASSSLGGAGGSMIKCAAVVLLAFAIIFQ